MVNASSSRFIVRMGSRVGALVLWISGLEVADLLGYAEGEAAAGGEAEG